MATMTEEEARKKWCPHARDWLNGDQGSCTVNRDGNGDPMASTRCIASECMAWRWARDTHETWHKQHNFHPWKDIPGGPTDEAPFPQPEGEGWELVRTTRWANGADVTWRRPLKDSDKRGFCGLAGTTS